MLECVINVSEGSDEQALATLDAVARAALVDRHSDRDHNRSVFTLAHADDDAVQQVARELATAVAERIDLRAHRGVHPRLGALDVVPFVALDPTPPGLAIEHAHRFATWWSDTFAVPTFFYDQADPARRTLPEVRRDAFAARTPDHGPDRAHPTLGATAVSARPPMVAINVDLATTDIGIARDIARTVRERDGGLPGVRALGFELVSRAQVQVSMNVVDLHATSSGRACLRVRELAAAARVEATRVELVGLVPRFDYEQWPDEFRVWSGLDETVTVEWRATHR